MFNYKTLEAGKIEYVPVAPLSDFINSDRLFIDIDGEKIVILKVAGQYYAIADVCSHDDGPVGEGVLEGLEIVCPRHGARFDIQTGQVLALPAFVDIPAYPVRVLNGQIEIGLPVEN
jgi:3-phenylpropionate/trans-cinnamate dioxygenase ferredoxin subunit